MTVIIDSLTHWLTNLSKTNQNHENIEKGTHIEWFWHDYWHDIGMKNVISSPCFCHGLWVLFRGIGAWLLKGWSQKGASISASGLVDSCGWFCCKYRSTSIFSGLADKGDAQRAVFVGCFQLPRLILPGLHWKQRPLHDLSTVYPRFFGELITNIGWSRYSNPIPLILY